ncbi:hypothetical protein [Viridibacillus arvi]|uniref:hypothetical protein n=1 Tax=Viridibacillus arvi TaxID=263475 RepID=UPI0034CE16A5
MIYLIPSQDSFIVYYNADYIPLEFRKDVIEVEALPEGNGILKMDEEGQLYWYQPDLPAPIEPQPTLEEMQMQTLVNIEYLVVMSELSNL